MDGRLNGDPQVKRTTIDVDGHAAVLRGARLGDVEASHDLDAHRHGRPIGRVQCASLVKNAIDAVANAQEAKLGLEVDVRGTALDAIGEQSVDEANHGVAVRVAAARPAGIDLAGLDLGQNAVDGQGVPIMAIDGAGDFRLAGEQRLNGRHCREQSAYMVDGDNIARIGHGESQTAAGFVEGQR